MRTAANPSNLSFGPQWVPQLYTNKPLKVLVACEYSGRVRDAFNSLGHAAVSCDLLPSDSPGSHVQGDVLDLLSDDFDLLVAHPPCTFLCNSGVRWLHSVPSRWADLESSASFFRKLLDCPIPLKVIENPIPHKYAVQLIGSKPDQFVQPYFFGDAESKRTALWLRGLPPLRPTNIVANPRQSVHLCPPGPDRWKIRSTTFPGFALALASQYGGKVVGLEGSA